MRLLILALLILLRSTIFEESVCDTIPTSLSVALDMIAADQSETPVRSQASANVGK